MEGIFGFRYCRRKPTRALPDLLAPFPSLIHGTRAPLPPTPNPPAGLSRPTDLEIRDNLSLYRATVGRQRREAVDIHQRLQNAQVMRGTKGQGGLIISVRRREGW